MHTNGPPPSAEYVTMQFWCGAGVLFAILFGPWYGALCYMCLLGAAICRITKRDDSDDE